jgi:Flp pilus assembly protein TadG
MRLASSSNEPVRAPLTAARRLNQRGSVTVWVLVIFVPVLLGLAGFALDLGILYSAKGELKTAANAAALAAAQQLIGTDAAPIAAQTAALQTIETASGLGNKYYFNGYPLNQSTGSLTSTMSDPAYFSDAADAIASGTDDTIAQTTGALAKYVRVTMTADTPLLYWSLLPVAAEHKASVVATAVAGVSPPLCLACSTLPIAIAAPNSADTTDYGLLLGTNYSFFYNCITGGPGGGAPTILPGATLNIPYVLLNRLDPNATLFPDETAQSFRYSAAGMPGSANTAQACFRVNNVESIWVNAPVNRCGAAISSVVTAELCGLDTRFESTTQTACAAIPGIDTLSTIYQPDSDITFDDLYTDYTGNGRRILTVAVVDSTTTTATMTVLGFRQFLLMPNQNATNINASDASGRFIGMYIGSVAPVPQGRFDGCTQTAGPGKVVLHQ